VHLWRAAYDPKLDRVVHRVASGFGHPIFVAVIAQAFQALRVSASLWEHGADWFPIHNEADVTLFELEHGVRGRSAYNGRHLAGAQRLGKAVGGVYRGLSDLFVPIVCGGKAVAVLVAGPYERARPTSSDILSRWRGLTGRQGHLADPEFAAFLAATLSTLVLEGAKVAAFERLLVCLSRLLAGEGDPAELANRAHALRIELEASRVDERMWEVVRTMVDERTPRSWYDVDRAPQLRRLGLTRRVADVLVCLTVSRKAGGDPVDEAVRRDALQRSAVVLARLRGDVLAGQVGDHGVVFLAADSGSPQRRKQKLIDFSERVSAVARGDFGLSLHFGASVVQESVPLVRSYEAALGAAESALAQGEPWVAALPSAPHAPLRHLREELGRVVEERPDLLAPRFDRYLEAVAAHSGYRIDPARGQLEMGFERLTRALTDSGALDAKSLETLRAGLDRAAGEARTVSDLFSAYRRAIADVARTVSEPVPARRDRSLRRAVEYIHQHYAEPLRLERVARVAGFHPDHFSRLFKGRERMTFEHYVRALRIERTKHLLVSTKLSVKRVAELSGLRSGPYLCRVFRRALGVSPLAYRRRPVEPRKKTVRKSS
jgi:AraC-like DNA-binding protein